MSTAGFVVKILYFGHDDHAPKGFTDFLNRAGFEVATGQVSLSRLNVKRYHLILSSHAVLPTDARSVRPPVALTARLKKSAARTKRPSAALSKPQRQLNLRALRGSAGKTQKFLAQATAMSQPQLSRIEARGDHLVSTLRKYVGALGGEIEVVARIRGQRVLLRDV